MSENKPIYEDDKFDVWDAEAKDTFVKMKTDWFSPTRNFNSRLHLSFVKHSGKPKCKQLISIEVGIPMVKAGSDGQKSGDTGITALALANLICTGSLAKMAQASKQDAATNNKKYADDIFICIGGTPSRRGKDGKAEFRKFSIAPSSSGKGYVLKASRCEGEDSATEGVQPKAGATWDTILVPVGEYYMRTLGETILAEWNAFRVAYSVRKSLGEAAAVPSDAPQGLQMPEESLEAPVATEQLPPKPLSTNTWVFMDESSFGIMGCATTVDGAVQKARICLNTLKKAKNYECVDNEVAVNMKNAIIASESTQVSVEQRDKETGAEWLLPVVPLINKQTGEMNRLRVMVFRNVQ